MKKPEIFISIGCLNTCSSREDVICVPNTDDDELTTCRMSQTAAGSSNELSFRLKSRYPSSLHDSTSASIWCNTGKMLDSQMPTNRYWIWGDGKLTIVLRRLRSSQWTPTPEVGNGRISKQSYWWSRRLRTFPFISLSWLMEPTPKYAPCGNGDEALRTGNINSEGLLRFADITYLIWGN